MKKKLEIGLIFCTLANGAVAFELSSPAFQHGGVIPDQFSYYAPAWGCMGGNQSPPLVIANAPAGTQSVAILVEDLDYFNYVHWKLWNIPASVTALPANLSAATYSQGFNSLGSRGYFGPCPNSPNHRYVFTAYALNTVYAHEPSVAEIKATTLATATLTGLRSPGNSGAWVPPAKEECLFAWAEKIFPTALSPVGATQVLPPFKYRYYAASNSYVGVSGADQNVYFLQGGNGVLSNLGPAEAWYAVAACSNN